MAGAYASDLNVCMYAYDYVCDYVGRYLMLDHCICVTCCMYVSRPNNSPQWVEWSDQVK